MSIEQKVLDKLSNLAKLDISEDKKTDIQSSLNDILGMVESIQSADTTNVTPLSNPLDSQQVLRSDTITETNQREKLLTTAPETDEGLFLVPQVID